MSTLWNVTEVPLGVNVEGRIIPAQKVDFVDTPEINGERGNYWHVWVPLENRLTALVTIPDDEIAHAWLELGEKKAAVSLGYFEGDDPEEWSYNENSWLEAQIEGGAAVRQTSYGAGVTEDVETVDGIFEWLSAWGSCEVIDSQFLRQRKMGEEA